MENVTITVDKVELECYDCSNIIEDGEDYYGLPNEITMCESCIENYRQTANAEKQTVCNVNIKTLF